MDYQLSVHKIRINCSLLLTDRYTYMYIYIIYFKFTRTVRHQIEVLAAFLLLFFSLSLCEISLSSCYACWSKSLKEENKMVPKRSV